jgi:hypothetical protein
MPAGDPDEGRMRRVVVACRDGAVARSERIGHVMVDFARLIVIDVDALGAWQHNEPLDGKADYVFWGRDAQSLARACGAPSLDEHMFGWVNVPIAEAREVRGKVRAMLDRNDWKVARDLRPHSHHHVLLEQVRATASASGEVVLGDARACGFATSWGDGIFEVHRDLDADGELVRLRIELGTPDRQKLMRRIEYRHGTCALVSKMVAEDGEPVLFMYREEADREDDSGWRMFSGRETEEYNADPDNIAIIVLAHLDDGRVDKLLDEPPGAVFERRDGDEDFVRVTDWTPPTEG